MFDPHRNQPIGPYNWNPYEYLPFEGMNFGSGGFGLLPSRFDSDAVHISEKVVQLLSKLQECETRPLDSMISRDPAVMQRGSTLYVSADYHSVSAKELAEKIALQCCGVNPQQVRFLIVTSVNSDISTTSMTEGISEAVRHASMNPLVRALSCATKSVSAMVGLGSRKPVNAAQNVFATSIATVIKETGAHYTVEFVGARAESLEADIVLNDLTQYMGICDFLEKRPTEVSVPHLLSKIKESLTAACRTNLCFEALVSKEVTAEQACPTSSSLSIVFVPQTFRALTRARLDHDAVLRLGISDRGLRTLPAWFKSVDVVDPWWQKIIAAGSGRTMTDGDAAKAFVGRALWIALNDPSDSQLVRSLGGRISSLRHERARVVLSAVVNAMDDSQAIKLIRNATNPHHVLTSQASDFCNALEEHCKYFIKQHLEEAGR